MPPPSHCRLPALQSHRAARFLQPRRPPRADPGRCLLLRSVPPYQFGVKRRLGQPHRLLQADFVLQPRRCLSLADNAPSLPLVTLHSLFLPGEAGVELNIVWQIGDGRCPGLLSAYRRGGGGSSAPLFRRWLAVVNKLVVILGEDVEHERASAFVGSIVDGTAIVTIRDLRGGRACIPRSIRSISYTTR